MCIIIIKKEGESMPSKDIMDDAWDDNPHGAGFMWVRNKTVNYEKGFMEKDKFLERINNHKFGKKDIVIMHFRWATSGKKDSFTTHPFEITKHRKIRKKIEGLGTKKTLLMHNGVISDLNNRKDASDTQRFATWYLSKLSQKEIYENKILQKLILKFVDDSRLVFLHHRLGLLTLGDWVESRGYTMSKTLYQKTGSSIGFGSYFNRASYWSEEREHNDIDADSTQLKLLDDNIEETCGYCGDPAWDKYELTYIDTWSCKMCIGCREEMAAEMLAIPWNDDNDWENVKICEEFKLDKHSIEEIKHYYLNE